MKSILKIFIFSFLVIGLKSFGQTNYYKINGGKVVDQSTYENRKEAFSKLGTLEILTLKIESKKDSLINVVRFTITSGRDPYSATKKYIGTKFNIEKFPDLSLKGKPTFINFWFTKCPPCIEEIPLLNKLKEKFGNDVNFVAISFNDKKTIEEFIKEQKFNFTQIPNSKSQIDEMKISAYPTSLILDKNGIIKFVYGEISFDINDIEIILDDLK